jgi:hypothetical protein
MTNLHQPRAGMRFGNSSPPQLGNFSISYKRRIDALTQPTLLMPSDTDLTEATRRALPRTIYIGDMRPLRITSRQASRALGAMKRSKTVQRLIHATLVGATKKDGSPWLILAQRGERGKPTLIDTTSLEEAYEAMLKGEEPPLFPSELKRPPRPFRKHSKA